MRTSVPLLVAYRTLQVIATHGKVQTSLVLQARPPVAGVLLPTSRGMAYVVVKDVVVDVR